ncbi:MAG TPA: PQQ-binding-like beta-propeller repeat protein, partial [Planctomycetaceae bacterium]|nr:PQQ-binding-like beta-propeller repeat protein [Planctomycetaceae bacterium]
MDWLVSNSTYFSLTTNGRQVFLVDGAGSALEALTSERGLRELPDEQQREALNNDVIAIDLNAVQKDAAQSSSWSLRARTSGDRSPFRNHTFLGPPAATPGLIVVLSEVDREVCAAAVDSETGEVHWIQPVAEPDTTILEDRERFKRSCTPVIARGFVLCPTQLGSLVALDLTTGAFAWVHAHYDPRPPVSRPAAYRSMAALPQTRNAAFNARPWVTDSRVVYLAGQSDAIYCLDLESGRAQWSVSQPDADAIATVTESAVVLLGRTSLRALSLENGAELWSVRLPVPPSGEAVAYQGELVVPLSKGSLWRVRLHDGAVLSKEIGSERYPTGHLAITRDGVVALGTDGLSAYQFTSVVRQELAKAATPAVANAADEFRFAEVALAEGNLAETVKHLEAARGLDAAGWAARTDPLLRGAYFSLLQSDRERRAVWLERLRPLCQTGEDQTRWLIARGEWEMDQGRNAELIRTFRELAERPGAALHEVAADPGLAVSGTGWMRRALRHLPEAQKTEVTDVLMAAGRDPSAARAVEAVFPQSPRGDGVRPQLANDARAQGQFHAAETWWLRNAESTDLAVAAAAVRQLAELYTENGMASAAAVQWERLATEFAKIDCGGTTGRSFVEAKSRQGGAVVAAYQRQAKITWPLTRAHIDAERREPTGVESAERVGNPQRELVFQAERYARWRMHPREDSDFEWTQRMDGAESYLLAWDRYAQHPRFHVPIPQGAIPFAPSFGRLAFERAIPIGAPAQMRMISVMQPATDGEAWSQKLPEWEDRSAVPMIGPGTLRLQLYQLRSTLVALDPADGQVLWRRNDLEPHSGLVDRAMGIFADDQVVGVLGADRISYRLLDAATGDVLRNGKLEADRSSLRFAAGARLIWVIEGADGKRVRIWDAAEDRVI